ncbi:hypothetical protein VNO78_04504 [Psophocarpus tetragonolobus]|uniref:Uncharacterized protein n=1 Tax=Psophocarpus tetragonolobus TaxID=3891 RepID=A0AAN9T5V8_PSOTE
MQLVNRSPCLLDWSAEVQIPYSSQKLGMANQQKCHASSNEAEPKPFRVFPGEEQVLLRDITAQEYNVTLQGLKASVSEQCSSASIVEQKWHQSQNFYYRYDSTVSELNKEDYVEAVLEWNIWKMLGNSTLQLPWPVNCYDLNSSGWIRKKES